MPLELSLEMALQTLPLELSLELLLVSTLVLLTSPVVLMQVSRLGMLLLQRYISRAVAVAVAPVAGSSASEAGFGC